MPTRALIAVGFGFGMIVVVCVLAGRFAEEASVGLNDGSQAGFVVGRPLRGLD